MNQFVACFFAGAIDADGRETMRERYTRVRHVGMHVNEPCSTLQYYATVVLSTARRAYVLTRKLVVTLYCTVIPLEGSVDGDLPG